MKTKLLLLFIFFAHSASHADLLFSANTQNMCGGKHYSVCGKEKNNELFKSALAEAQQKKQHLIVVMGANYCPACREFSYYLSLPDTEEGISFLTNNNYLFVKINAEGQHQLVLQTLKEMAKINKQKWKSISYLPTFYLVKFSQETKVPCVNQIPFPRQAEYIEDVLRLVISAANQLTNEDSCN